MRDNTGHPEQQDAYMHDYDGALTEQVIAGRTADVHGAYFLPYLWAVNIGAKLGHAAE